VKSVVPSPGKNRPLRDEERRDPVFGLYCACGLQCRRDLRDWFTLMVGDSKLIGVGALFSPETEDDP